MKLGDIACSKAKVKTIYAPCPALKVRDLNLEVLYIKYICYKNLLLEHLVLRRLSLSLSYLSVNLSLSLSISINLRLSGLPHLLHLLDIYKLHLSNAIVIAEIYIYIRIRFSSLSYSC